MNSLGLPCTIQQRCWCCQIDASSQHQCGACDVSDGDRIVSFAVTFWSAKFARLSTLVGLHFSNMDFKHQHFCKRWRSKVILDGATFGDSSFGDDFDWSRQVIPGTNVRTSLNVDPWAVTKSLQRGICYGKSLFFMVIYYLSVETPCLLGEHHISKPLTKDIHGLSFIIPNKMHFFWGLTWGFHGTCELRDAARYLRCPAEQPWPPLSGSCHVVSIL